MSAQTATARPGVSRETFLALMWLFTSLAFVFTIARLTIRLKLFKALGLDDFLVILAWCLLLATAIVWQIEIHTLYWFFAVVQGKTAPTPAFEAAFAKFTPNFFTWNVLYYCCLWSVKYSFLVFFRKLDGQARTIRVRWWIILAITTAGLLISIGDFQFKCSLKNVDYIFANCGSPSAVSYDAKTLYVNMALDVLTDILILSLPFRILWGIKISKKNRMILFTVFSATIVIMVIAIIRAVLVKPDPSNNKQQNNVDWLYFWSIIEMGVAIMIANVASFRQLFVGTGNPLDPGAKTSSASGRGLVSYLRHLKSVISVASGSRNRNVNDVSDDKPGLALTPMNAESGASKHTSTVYVQSTFEVVHSPMAADPQASEMQRAWSPIDGSNQV